MDHIVPISSANPASLIIINPPNPELVHHIIFTILCLLFYLPFCLWASPSWVRLVMVSVIVKKQFENIFVARYLQKLNANAVRVRIPWKLVQQVSFIHVDLQTQRGRDKRTQFWAPLCCDPDEWDPRVYVKIRTDLTQFLPLGWHKGCERNRQNGCHAIQVKDK